MRQQTGLLRLSNRLSRPMTAAVLAFVLLLSGTPIWAGPCALLPDFIRSKQGIILDDMTQDVAVELEMGMSSKLMSLVTTVTGKLDALALNTYPEEFTSWAATNASGVAPAEVNWDQLPYSVQRALLKAVGLQAAGGGSPEQAFFRNRKVPGMKVRDTIRLTFPKRMPFFGAVYGPGPVDVPTAGFFVPYVEYKSPKSVAQASGFEMHIRARDHAGDVSRDSRVLQKLLGLEVTHQHAHVVATAPMRFLAENTPVRAMTMTYFVTRVNRLAEMKRMLEGGPGLRKKQVDNATYFDFLRPYVTPHLYTYFAAMATDAGASLYAGLRMAFVGARSGDTYDNHSLWGLEYRALGRNSSSAFNRLVLNALQAKMEGMDFAIPDAQMGQWMEKQQVTGKGDDRTPVNPHVASGYETYSPESVKQLLAASPEIVKILRDQYADHAELDWFLFDWSRDPAYFQNPERCQQIEAEQRSALQRLGRGESIITVAQDFVLRSGILTDDLASIGVTDRPTVGTDPDGF